MLSYSISNTAVDNGLHVGGLQMEVRYDVNCRTLHWSLLKVELLWLDLGTLY